MVTKILRNFWWLKHVSSYEISLFRQMDQFDFFLEEIEKVESFFKAFDVAEELDGKISFSELEQVFRESGLLT